MARVPARLQFRVQLRFVTEEQLFGAGPLSLPTPKSLQLDVHLAGEEADATVTDGEVPSPAGKLGPEACEHNVRARRVLRRGAAARADVCGVRVCFGERGSVGCSVSVAPSRCAPRGSPGGNAGLLPQSPAGPNCVFIALRELGCRGQPGPENLSWR